MTELTQLVPHRAPMLLIENILESSPERVVAKVDIRQNTFGFENGAVPAWFGVEYMAQAIAAYSGQFTVASGEKPGIGFLVGVRGYEIGVKKFNLGSQVTVTVVPNFIVDNAGTFDCKISVDEVEVGKATITTFKPDSSMVQKMLEEKYE